ncbi:MAG TPA: type II secretion system F family protein [Candidatus Omnitrophota bacterium]|nr:type II secretion system F family protein [Candidatus Omnitrophota bacterium]
MQTYSYKARDNAGKLVTGVLAAENETELYGHLTKLGYILTFARPVAASAAGGKSEGTAGARMQSNEVLYFTTQLFISLDSGVPLLTSLKDLAKNSENKKVQMVINDIIRRVESGTNLKEALEAHPRSFNKLYTAIIDAGESTGKLPIVLEDLAKLLEWQMDIKSKVTEASIYPIVLFSVMIMVVLVLIGVVIPKFKPMLEQLGVGLPTPTLVVLAVSSVIEKFWWAFLLCAGGVVGGLMVLNSKPQGKLMVDRAKLNVPIFGDLLYKIALSRFCHTFALSLRAGVNVFSSLGIAAQVVNNSLLESSLNKAREYVNVGEKISTSLELASKDLSKKYPDIVIRMIQVGEQSGNLAQTMEKVNQYYDKEVPSAIRKIFAMMEPLLVVVMGIVVAGIAMAVFLPMISMISNVGGK